MPAANFIRKTNAELMQVALIGRKRLSDKVKKVGESENRDVLDVYHMDEAKEESE